MKTDVVLLPGLHGSTALFEGFIALAPPWARCRPIALPIDCVQTFDALADALQPQLRALETFVLFGESFSAPIAARLSQRFSEKVALLVLSSPLIEPPFPMASSIGASFIQSRWIPSWAVAALMTGGDRRLAAALLREARNLPRDLLAARLATVATASRDDLLAYLQAPVLAVGGASDRLLSSRVTEDLMKNVPFGIYTEVPAPHLAAQVAPDRVWAAISEEFETAA
jgi:pimeloyl-[acyl-carrier protein] methyl ester esterase